MKKGLSSSYNLLTLSFHRGTHHSILVEDKKLRKNSVYFAFKKDFDIVSGYKICN